jgi:methyl-accepting chemotaxis protein
VVNLRIKTKLLLLLAVVVCIMTLLITTMYVRTTSVTTKLANDEAMTSVNYMTEIIDFYFIGLENIGANARPGLTALFSWDGSIDKKALEASLAVLLDANKKNNVMEVYVGLESDGSLTCGSGYVAGEDFDSRTREWYQKALAERKTIVTSPYIDVITKKLVISTGTPMFDGAGNVLGVIGSDISLESLASEIRTASVFGAGFGVLLNADGTVLEHPDTTFINTENLARESAKVTGSMAAIGKKMVSGETGFGDYTLLGTSRRIYYKKSASGYISALVFPHAQLRSVVRSVTMTQIVSGVIALILIIIYMILMIPSIIKPMRAVQTTLERMSSLDLTSDQDAVKIVSRLDDRTELGAMIASLRNMRKVFSDVVSAVRDSVGQLAVSSGTLDNLSQSAIEEVNSSQSAAMNVDRLAQDALDSVGATTSAVQQVTHAATMTAASATEGAEASGATSRLSAEVSEMVNEFVAELQTVGNASLENSEGMKDVGSSVAAIGEFVTSIRNIASQTNLLALNAAIEAARAGDAGRGFAVVADEVRKLAEESNVASHHVAEMMENLERGAKNAIGSAQESANVISEIIAKARETQESLKNALSEIGKVDEAVQSIAAAAEEQAASSNEIAESSSRAKDSIDNVAREISAITGATLGTQEAIKKVTLEAGNISGISDKLENLIASFTIEEGKK